MNSRFNRVFFIGNIILNFVLIGLLLRPSPPQTDQPAPQPAASPVTAPQPAPFRWSQLEATDYATYIANLRGIGCPERTVREIVAADVDDLYAPRREPLLARIGAGGDSPEVTRSQDALAQLRYEEESLMRKLFGIPDPSPASAPATAQAASSSGARSPMTDVVETNVSIPLVFQAVDTHRLQLTAEQLQSIAEVRQSFLGALGNNPDVNSPEYLKRWQAAQKQADNLMGALIGRQAELDYEDAAQSQASAGNGASAGN